MSDLSPTEKLLVQELADIKGKLAKLVEASAKDAALPHGLPSATYDHAMSPKAGVKAPAPEPDPKFAGMASIYGKEQPK